ncbi:microtubule-associated protein 1B-like [Ptychodera flava]|uniref:microtubule-associated protein 1B-like n=1 Tax=Ptychodera flava TaxID=63121 RepID=UPI003969DA52
MAMPSSELLMDRLKGTIYGNCVGDAIGLLTEFMSKEEANSWYGDLHELELKDKERVGGQFHQSRWEIGDWTDDSDQMILILQSILDRNGQVEGPDFAKKMRKWAREGFSELGDMGGMGIGMTTYNVINDPKFKDNPHQVAEKVWIDSGRFLAPNGAVMRTSILGIHQYQDIEKVINNTLEICKTTHADPRCAASCVAVTTAIAMMLNLKSENVDVKDILDKSYKYAKKQLKKSEKEELKKYMYCEDLDKLMLDEHNKIGYTYKCLGAGFWAFKQKDFRKALTSIVREAGDADTNGAVAGALLGCKLGYKKLPESWKDGLCHRKWLDNHIKRFCKLSLPQLSSGKSADETDAASKKPSKKGKDTDTGTMKSESDKGDQQNIKEEGTEVQGGSSKDMKIDGGDAVVTTQPRKQMETDEMQGKEQMKTTVTTGPEENNGMEVEETQADIDMEKEPEADNKTVTSGSIQSGTSYSKNPVEEVDQEMGTAQAGDAETQDGNVKQVDEKPDATAPGEHPTLDSDAKTDGAPASSEQPEEKQSVREISEAEGTGKPGSSVKSETDEVEQDKAASDKGKEEKGEEITCENCEEVNQKPATEETTEQAEDAPMEIDEPTVGKDVDSLTSGESGADQLEGGKEQTGTTTNPSDRKEGDDPEENKQDEPRKDHPVEVQTGDAKVQEGGIAEGKKHKSSACNVV